VWLALLTVCVVAYLIGRARAGIPTTTPLYYSGLLEDANGPVSDTKAITVSLFDAATAGSSVCAPSPSGAMPTKTQVVAGRFRIALDPSCATALQSKADVWIEVNVEGQPLPRSKIGAVPYALSAGNVDWGGVSGVSATSEWPGTIPYSRVTNPARPVYTNTQTGKTYSVNAGYCGSTAKMTGSVNDGQITGYAATKSLCEKACNNSPTAHMCSTEELIRTQATGGGIPNAGWYNAGVRSWDGNGATAKIIDDCTAWTVGANTAVGSVWQVAGPSIADDYFCNNPLPILCCD
jgi:hypothetical protein